jgi:hypothetical protein
MPEANDPNVERIASELMDYITGCNLFPDTLKFTICEALYEMQAITRGQTYEPAVRVMTIGADGDA